MRSAGAIAGPRRAGSSASPRPADVAAATPPVALLGAWTLLAIGAAYRYGTFRLTALLCVVAAWMLLVVLVARGGRDLPLPGGRSAPALRATVTRAGLPPALLAPAVLVVIGPLVWPSRFYAEGGWATASQVLSVLAGVAAVVAIARPQRRQALCVGLPAGLAVAALAAAIPAAPRPAIDVWYLLQESTAGLFRGDNLYQQTWPGSPGLTDVYPYLPISSVLLLPARWLTGDVRVGLVVAAALAAWWAGRLSAPRWLPLVPLLLLLHPRSAFGIEQAWTEPLLLACLAAMPVAVRRQRPGLAVLALALALASKQHVALLLPLVVWWPELGPRRAAQASGLAGLLVLPWFLADPGAMLADAVTFNLALPVLERGLTVPSLLARAGVTLSFLPLLVALIAVYALVVRRLPRDATGFCLGSALVLLTLDLLNKQSFFNHYTLPLGLLVLAACTSTSLPDQDPQHQPTTSADPQRGGAG